MRKNLYLVIIGVILLSLTSACLLCLLLINKFSIDALLMNLAINSLAIFITVFIVDKILKIHEKEKWKGVSFKIKESIQRLINATISSVRISFGYKLDDICSYEVYKTVFADPEKYHLMEEELIRISEEILKPTANNKVNKMNTKDWSILNDNLKNIYSQSERIISLFGNKISPKQYELIFDFEDAIDSILTQYTTWPDFIGVPDKELPEGGLTPPIEWKQALNDNISKYIKILLNRAKELYYTIKNKTD